MLDIVENFQMNRPILPEVSEINRQVRNLFYVDEGEQSQNCMFSQEFRDPDVASPLSTTLSLSA